MRVLKGSGEAVSADGTHLGHNLPDGKGAPARGTADSHARLLEHCVEETCSLRYVRREDAYSNYTIDQLKNKKV